MTDGLRRACVDALAGSSAELSVEGPLRLFIALANAVTTGLLEGLEDPFIHEPTAMRHLERRCEAMGARSAITALDWSRAHDEARCLGRGRSPESPEVLAAICIALEQHVREEHDVLRTSLLAIGMMDEPASGVSSRTVLAGFAMTITGGDERWARLLAKGNTETLSPLSLPEQDIARKLQADTMRRFLRIMDFLGLRNDLSEAGRTVNSGCAQIDAQQDPKKTQINPSTWRFSHKSDFHF
ncbi:hypothetical protein [Paracoccus sp. ME4]|uniref:hypothetical protein n=1 Tax=Paracoccus sp. ME4 TaxID=3138066 RepID=UPI00398BA906